MAKSEAAPRQKQDPVVTKFYKHVEGVSSAIRDNDIYKSGDMSEDAKNIADAVVGLRSQLLGFEEPQLAALFTAVHSKRSEKARQKIGVLWPLFVHPSFEVFKAFLREPRIWNSYSLRALDRIKMHNPFFHFSHQTSADAAGAYARLVFDIHSKEWSHVSQHSFNGGVTFYKVPDLQNPEVQKEFRDLIAKASEDPWNQRHASKDPVHRNLKDVVFAHEAQQGRPDIVVERHMLRPSSNFTYRSVFDERTLTRLFLQPCPEFGVSDIPLTELGAHFSIEGQLSLHDASPETIKRLTETQYGLLPLGVKAHGKKSTSEHAQTLPSTAFVNQGADVAYQIPPVGNLEALKEVDGMIEKLFGMSFFNNPDYQIQMCMAGTLRPRNVAILTALLYLGGDDLTEYEASKFLPEDVGHRRFTGSRLAIRGAGALNQHFASWITSQQGGPVKVPIGEISGSSRTDMRGLKSFSDAENFWYFGTLLMHADNLTYKPPHHYLGEEFIKDFRDLFKKFGLLEIIDNDDWIVDEHNVDDLNSAARYTKHMQALYAHAKGEKIGYELTGNWNGLVAQLQDLLARYKMRVREDWEKMTKK